MKRIVHTLLRPLLGAAAVLALGTLTPAAAMADPPTVQTGAATAITDSAATLNGVVDPRGSRNTVYSFQYGVTTNYDSKTPPAQLRTEGEGGPRPVSATVTGLQPATTYHFRLFAGNGAFSGWNSGEDVTFTTAPAPVPAPVAPVAVVPPAVALAAPPPAPALGRAVAVAPVSGTVRVKVPGATRYVVLAAGASIPTGAALDTRAGEIELTTALPDGTTQTARFHGGVFRVRQSAAGGGMTDIDLRGPVPTCPRSQGTARAAAAARRKPPRKLWGSDKGGRFRTHGRNSVATVRGTRWVTTDSCAGTRTTVTEGAVSVRDLRRKRTVLVRAGHSYLARKR